MWPVTTSEHKERSSKPLTLPIPGQREVFTHAQNKLGCLPKAVLFQGQGPRLLLTSGYPILGPCAPGAVPMGRGARSEYRPLPRGLSRAADRLHPRAPRKEPPSCRATASGRHTARGMPSRPPASLPRRSRCPRRRAGPGLRSPAPAAPAPAGGSLGIAAARECGQRARPRSTCSPRVLTPRSPWSRAGAGCPC